MTPLYTQFSIFLLLKSMSRKHFKTKLIKLSTILMVEKLESQMKYWKRDGVAEWFEAPVCGCLVGYQVQFPTAVACVYPLCYLYRSEPLGSETFKNIKKYI